MAVATADDPRGVSINILVVALWFGMIAGLLEGAVSLALQQLGRLYGVWVEIIWVSPVFSALLFGALGVALVLLYLAYRRLPALTVAVFIFTTMTLFIILEVVLPWPVHAAALLLLATGISSVFTRWFARHRGGAIRFWRRSLPVVSAVTVLAVVGVMGGFRLLEATA